MLLFIITAALPAAVTAQKKQYNTGAVNRCFTMERVRLFAHTNPADKVVRNQKISLPNNINNRPLGASDTVYIPVVFHIVLPNPYLITDDVVQSQIDKLNKDFSGLNADSTNAPAFYGVRGHSNKIRFVLAKRTPASAITNGIERLQSSITSKPTLSVDPIKRTALGGLNAWEPSAYLNCWVGDPDSSKFLGYAQFPGGGLPEDDGVFCNYQSFGISNCNNPSYNKGGTVVHEAGHYFGLFHNWGDEDNCNGDDFRPLSDAGSSVVLPANLFNQPGNGNASADIGDTPNQTKATNTCLTGIVTDACSVSAPGIMYQNYMDYTLDNCYSLFTKKQVQRMEWVLDNIRAALKTSSGALPPATTVTTDASPFAAVNPGGQEAVNCNAESYPQVQACPGTMIPKIRVRNNGTGTINSFTTGLLVNGLLQTPVAVKVPPPGLLPGYTMVVSFPVFSVITGTYTFKFFTYNINGNGVDDMPANDTLTTTLAISPGETLPDTEDFEKLPFPSSNWSLFNPDGDATWKITNTGNAGHAMFIDNYSKNNTGLTDELRTPKFIVSVDGPVTFSFDLAYKNYPFVNDELSILVSGDCGGSWAVVYKKSGDSLSTAGSSTQVYETPVKADWKNERIDIPDSLLKSGEIIFAVRNTGAYGNNIFIDNISIVQKTKRDILPEAIIDPSDKVCPANDVAPRVTVSNNGSAAVWGFTVGYSINGSPAVYKNFTDTIEAGKSITVSLNAVKVLSGLNKMSVFTSKPFANTGTGDLNVANDTISKNFVVQAIIQQPLQEGFEGAAFAPSDWELINPDANNTWVKDSVGNNSSSSAFIDNFTSNNTGEKDALRTPATNVQNADSIFVSFDLAYKNFPGADDILKVNISTDCGNTFTTVYNKKGAALATAGSSADAFLKPLPTDWQQQKITLNSTFATGGNIIAEFESISGYGNNIFIDNIHISTLVKRDLSLVSIVQPALLECANGQLAPLVIAKNTGIDTITAFTITCTLDGILQPATTVTGLALAAGSSTTVSLNTITSTPGNHVVKIFSYQPVTATGTGDLNTQNDTLSRSFAVTGRQLTFPLTESFEGNFSPANWALTGNNDSNTFVQSNSAASLGHASLFITKKTAYPLAATGQLISPLIKNSNAIDSVLMTFDVAYQQQPATTNLADTLEIQVTKDCGKTYETIWKKWGSSLQTVANIADTNANRFVPKSSDWKNIRCYLSPFTVANDFQVNIVAHINQQNNLWIDNIDIESKILPATLKAQGYLLYPNPFKNNFLLHHYQVPRNLLSVQVYTASGQLAWEQKYNGNAVTETVIDLSSKPNGIYLLKLNYSNNTVLQKIIKAN